RGKAFERRLREHHPGIRWAGSVTHDGSVAGATKTIEAFLGTHPDLDLLWFGDGLSGSMANVMQDHAPAVKFVATDIAPQALEGVKAGKIFASIAQDTFTEAFFGFQMLYYARNNYRVPDALYLGTVVVTRDNAEQLLKNPYRKA